METKYDVLLSEVIDANEFCRRLFAESPTITELSKLTGATEENILESMEFGLAC